MEYKYLNNEFNINENILPESERINSFLLKHQHAETIKALNFLSSDEKILYIHGFLGTGKRQFINYISEYLNKDVIKLEYYCKPSTVCDDILLAFINIIENNSLSKAVSSSAKITTLAVKFQKYIESIKKPFIVVLHSFDDILEENRKLITDCICSILTNANIKIVLSTRAMLQDLFGEVKVDKKLFLKPFSKEIFTEFVKSYDIACTEDALNDFYKYSRGYYYYTLLAIKIMQSMNLSINDFLTKFVMSGMSFDSYLGHTYLNLVPNTIRNFFWFLRTIRHGISINALAVFELYDEFSVDYLCKNYMIYIANDVIYVQDYFQQDIDISIPIKTEIKLHKYIIGIYEKELKESLQSREILMSRQALRAEIDYHTKKISELENHKKSEQAIVKTEAAKLQKTENKNVKSEQLTGISEKMDNAKKFAEGKNYTDAIEAYLKIIRDEKPDSNTLAEIRMELGRLYRLISDYQKSQHYYELVEKYYKEKEEVINLNYLYYELTMLYFDMYKIERAIETAKQVIYSVDTPTSLLIDACTLLGNIYSESKKYEEASKYYQKALESIDENTQQESIADLYFKYALMCDEINDGNKAFEYYTKCLSLDENNPYKALSYSNMGACYYDNGNLSDAESCFLKAYKIEKNNNNYDGIYFTSSYLAKIYSNKDSVKEYNYLQEAKQSAEFINEDFYILEATIALGDYYYNRKDKTKNALIEYFKAIKVARNFGDSIDIKKIEERIEDMKRRCSEEDFEKIEEKYGK